MGIIDNAKEIVDLVKKAGDIELYRKIVELEGEIVELTRQKRSLEEQIEELRSLLNIKQQMVFKKPFYYQGDDPHPYCPKCWDADKVAVHLNGPEDMQGGPCYDCLKCRSVIMDPKRKSFPTVESESSPWAK